MQEAKRTAKRTASILPILCKILCKIVDHATMNLPNGITILALKRIIVDLLFQYILSITLWKRYSWIKAHEQRPDVDNRIGLMQVSSYKEYTCFTIMNVYTTIKSNFSFFFYEFSRTNGRLNGRLCPSSNIIKLYYSLYHVLCFIYSNFNSRIFIYSIYIKRKDSKQLEMISRLLLFNHA